MSDFTVPTPTFNLAHDPLTPLSTMVYPTPLDIRKLQRELYDNVRGIECQLGGNNHGHLGLLMADADYLAKLTGFQYVIPPRPGYPALGGMNQNARAMALIEYKEDLRLYTEVQTLITVIKKQMLKAIPHVYLKELEDDMHGFAHLTPLQVLQHMKTTYGSITPQDLEHNLKELEAPWDPATPLETLFANGIKCRQLAQAGGDPISDQTYIRKIIQVLTDSGVFTQAIHEWNIKPLADKTVANLRIHFYLADKERRLNDKSTKATLQAHATQQPKTTKQPTSNSDTTTRYYCWTHGLGLNANHTSATCTNPAAGHIKHATLQDMQGGNNTIRRKPGEKAVYVPPKRNGGRNANTAKASTNTTTSESNPFVE